jgi:hypothetical protein
LIGSAQPISSSSIARTVHDPLAAAVVDAEVTVKNLASDETNKATTDAAGAFSIEGLIPGSYEVTAGIQLQELEDQISARCTPAIPGRYDAKPCRRE